MPSTTTYEESKNKILLKSVHGARRTVVPNAITLRGGSPQIVRVAFGKFTSNLRRQLMYPQMGSEHNIKLIFELSPASRVGFLKRVCFLDAILVESPTLSLSLINL